MEHRWSKRFDINVDVSLYHRGSSVIRCTTDNAGTAGIFVDTGQNTLAKNTLLEVEFEDNANLHDREPRVFRLRAMVAHASNKGLGLMFLKSEAETILAWRQVLKGSHEQLYGYWA